MRTLMTIPLALALAGCAGFAWRDDPQAGRLHLSLDAQPVLSYCYGDQLAAGVPEKFTRSSYIHPIHGLDGEVLTEDFPRDHLHHRGLSLMWPVMKVGSKSCDLWTIRAVRSVFQNKLYQRASAGLAELGILNVWLMEDGTEAAQEQLHLRVHAATDRGRLLDVRYVLTAGREPITLRGQTNQNKGYGGLVLRTPHESRRTDTVITTDQGRAEGDSLRAPYGWADLSARMPGGDGVSGVTVIPARSHPDFPPGWMLRHYGVLNPAWPGTREFVMQPGVPLELSYRIYVHRGDLAEGAVAQVCDQWQQSR